MQIRKRNGTMEPVKFEKISKRLKDSSKNLDVDHVSIAQKVIEGLYDGISSQELDILSSEVAYSNSTKHYDYDKLATRLVISRLHKDTPSTFSECVNILSNATDSFGNNKCLLADDFVKFVKKHAHVLDACVNYSRDFDYDYFGYKTLERSYLLKTFVRDGYGKLTSKIVERPQHMLLRVAVAIHLGSIQDAINTYEMLSTKQFTHATPTLFNAGLVKNQLSSCFLIANKEDSISGIYDTLKEVALISQASGGIGLHVHNVRSRGSQIFGTGGVSSGLTPMLKNFNETTRYVDQGGGRRKGSAAIYLETHHADIFEFLDLRKNSGKEELRARDLNLALWTPDLFFKRVEADQDWTLMDPNKCKGLSDVYGDEFDKLYESYESQGLGERTIKARDLWKAIIESQIETGQPYILAKDTCNKYSNQKNLGTIKSSNLCLEANSVVQAKRIDKNSGQIDGPYYTTLQDLHHDFLKRSHHYDYEVLGWDFQAINNPEVFKKIKSVKYNGNKDVIKVKSSNTNHYVFATKDHQIFTTRNGFWKDAEHISFLDDLRLSKDDNFELYSVKNSPAFKNDVDVYDIEIDLSNMSIEDKKEYEYDQRNFFANGILVHNCAEIIEYSSPEETAVCNLASVSLPSCVEGKKGKRTFNFVKLAGIVKTMTENLNKIIDTEYYPVETTRNSNLKHRPIGIGIQGLADVFALMRYSWESEEAKLLNTQIAETLYYSFLDTSSDLAKKHGTYSSYEGSDLDKGILHFDHYNHIPTDLWDWKKVRNKIKKNGVRNSLGIALMPTASTSQILGNTESFEIVTSNMYKRSTLSGEFIMLNKHLVNDLIDLGLWNDKLRQKIIYNQGSVQNISEIPDDIKVLYKTAWETSQKIVIDMACNRQIFCDQSQSMNLYFSNPNSAKITSALFHGWKSGLKTLVYYMRSNGASEAKQITVDQSIVNESTKEENVLSEEELEQGLTCSLDNRENCEMCSG